MIFVSAVVDISLRDDSERRYRLPGADPGTRSMLYRFVADDGTELLFGGEAIDADSSDFVPGGSHAGVRLTLWIDLPEHVPPKGAPFVVWYGGDIGDGVVHEISSL